MPLAAHEFDRVVRKFGFETRNSRDLLAWLVVDGKVVVRTRRSKKATGDLPMFHSIRQQLKLSDRQLRDAISCRLGRDAYIEIVRSTGIVDGSPDR